MYCNQCGKEAKPEARFCVHCGNPLGKVKSAENAADAVHSLTDSFTKSASEETQPIQEQQREFKIPRETITSGLITAPQHKARAFTNSEARSLLSPIRLTIFGAIVVAIAGLIYLYVIHTAGGNNPSLEASVPTIIYARKAINDEVNYIFSGRLAIIDIQKTDGQLSQRNGIPVYILEFKATTEATESLFYAGGISGIWEIYNPPTSTYYILPSFGRIPVQDPHTPQIWKGERYVIDGTVSYEKKESGWILGGVNTTVTSPYDKSAPSLAQVQHTIYRNLVYDTAGGLKVISSEEKSALPLGPNQYKVEFTSVVEAVTDLIIDSGRLTTVPSYNISVKKELRKEQPSILENHRYVLSGTLEFAQQGTNGWWMPSGGLYVNKQTLLQNDLPSTPQAAPTATPQRDQPPNTVTENERSVPNISTNQDFQMLLDRTRFWTSDWGSDIKGAISKSPCKDPDLLKEGYQFKAYSSLPISRIKKASDAWYTFEDRAVTVLGCWFNKENGLIHFKIKRKKDSKVFEQDVNLLDGSWKPEPKTEE